MRKAWLLAVSSMVFVHFPLMADDSLVRFEGGHVWIGPDLVRKVGDALYVGERRVEEYGSTGVGRWWQRSTGRQPRSARWP